jgi:DNA-binding transcriptional ArsR family regulator
LPELRGAGPDAESEGLDLIFGALSDPTRRAVLARLMDAGSTSVPALSAALPISRQAVAKHVQVLDDAGLIERAEVTGREVHYRLTARALAPAVDWMTRADAAWSERLARLKRAAETRPVR